MSEKVKAIERASDILLLIHNSGGELGITEIAERLDLHKSTVHRILATFKDRGIVRETEDERYAIGLQIYAMGLKVAKNFSAVNIIKPYINELAKKVGEVVNLSILEDYFGGNYKTILIDKEYSSSNVLSVNPNVGESTDAHVSSAGKCLLAYSKQVDMEMIHEENLKQYTQYTIIKKEQLLLEMKNIRTKGYALDNEEREIGLFCIGVPVFDRKGECTFAISISGPTVRMNNEELQTKIEALLETQKNVNNVLKSITK